MTHLLFSDVPVLVCSVFKMLANRFNDKRPNGRLRKYFTQTTLHGISYIIDKDASIFASVFWTMTCLMCAGLCIVLISKQIMMFQNNRLFTGIGTTSYPIWKVPFPAVTLCNFNVVHKSSVEPIAEILKAKHFSDPEIRDFFMNLSTNILHDDLDSNRYYGDIVYALNTAGYDTDKLMKSVLKLASVKILEFDSLHLQVAQPCEELLLKCLWLSEEMHCMNLFQTIKTRFGYCCSFNYRGVSQSKELNMSTQVLGIGPRFGLQVVFDTDVVEYMSAIEPHYGVHVMIHESHEYPDEFQSSVAVTPASDVTFAVSALVSSEMDIRFMDPSVRGCLFDDEGKPHWSGHYTYANCMSECQAMLVENICGCIPFYYPSSSNARYCTVMDLKCLQDYQVDGHEKNQMLSDGGILTCDCLPQCNEVTYTYLIDEKQSIAVAGFENVSNFSRIQIYFARSTCMQIIRQVYITWDYVTASIGGIFGLCLGGSVISIIEIAYHFVQAMLAKLKTKPIKKKISPEKETKLKDFERRFKMLEEPKIYVNELRYWHESYHRHH